MGYHVAIVRTAGGRPDPIRADELAKVVERREDLRLEPDASGRLHVSSRPRGTDAPLLAFQDGEIWTSNPDRATLQTMIDIARELGARVRGDELETYRTPDETYRHPEDRAEAEGVGWEARRLARRTRWRGWALWLLIMGAFILAGSVVELCSRR